MLGSERCVRVTLHTRRLFDFLSHCLQQWFVDVFSARATHAVGHSGDLKRTACRARTLSAPYRYLTDCAWRCKDITQIRNSINKTRFPSRPPNWYWSQQWRPASQEFSCGKKWCKNDRTVVWWVDLLTDLLKQLTPDCRIDWGRWRISCWWFPQLASQVITCIKNFLNQQTTVDSTLSSSQVLHLYVLFNLFDILWSSLVHYFGPSVVNRNTWKSSVWTVWISLRVHLPCRLGWNCCSFVNNSVNMFRHVLLSHEHLQSLTSKDPAFGELSSPRGEGETLLEDWVNM